DSSNGNGENSNNRWCVISPEPVGGCSIAHLAVDPAKLCSGAATCPVTALAQLTCDIGTYPNISLAPSTGGASVLLNVPNIAGMDGEVDATLFTIRAGADDVERFRNVVNAQISTDSNGISNIIGETAHGPWRLRRTTGV